MSDDVDVANRKPTCRKAAKFPALLEPGAIEKVGPPPGSERNFDAT